MRIHPAPFWRVISAALLVGLMVLGGCKTTPPEEEEGPKSTPPAEAKGPYADLVKCLPGAADITNWKPEGEPTLFGPSADPAAGVEPIEKDLGADAKVLRSYAFVAAARQRYKRGQGGETVTLRLFQMKTPSEAFGIFSVRSRGDQFPLVGLAARMGADVLHLVKGPFYATVRYQGPGDATPALMEFGRWVADQISSPGYRPALLETFPLGSVQGERYYLHDFETLASLPFVPKGDPAAMARMLDLSQETNVAIMGYPTTREGVLNYLFVIQYPSSVEAQAAYTAYMGYLENSTHPAERNVAVAPPVGAYLAGTFNAEENSIRDLLAKLLEGLGG